MSVASSTVRPPSKHVRYLTDDSSYSSFSTTASIRREAEEQAARELALERQASRQRVLSVWDNLEQRYSRALDDDDIVDLETLTLVQDTGTLRQIADAPFGSLAAQDELSENDEDDDELGNWDDERYSAEHAWNRLQTGGEPRQRTQEDEQDLKEFLRAEKQRRRERGEQDEEEEDYSHTERETEAITTENGEDGDESVSSFRPTPSQDAHTTSASGSDQEEDESEDELDGLTPVKQKTRPAPAHDGEEEEATEVISDRGTSSSEDEIAVSDVEKERRFREHLRTEEPLGRGRFASVRPSDSPTKVSRNLQLSTPPRSKSFSTPSDTLYQNSSPRQKTPAMRMQTSRTYVRAGTAARNIPAARQGTAAPPMPNTSLGKRKRRESPLPTPSSDDLSPRHRPFGRAGPGNSRREDYEEHQRYSHGRTDSSSHTEPPMSIDDYEQDAYDDDGYESVDEVDSLSYSRTTPSPVNYRTAPQTRTVQQDSTPRRRQMPTAAATRRESLAPEDLSQLVFHLKKVNEWVKTYHGDELPFDEEALTLPRSLPLLPPERAQSKRPPAVPAFAHVRAVGEQWDLATPPNRNRVFGRSSAGGTGGSSARSSRTYSSMGPPPTPSRLFETSSSAPSSAHSTPNKSPVRSSGSRGYRAASVRATPVQVRAFFLLLWIVLRISFYRGHHGAGMIPIGKYTKMQRSDILLVRGRLQPHDNHLLRNADQ